MGKEGGGGWQNHLSEKLQWQIPKLLAGIGTLPAVAASPKLEMIVGAFITRLGFWVP